MNVAIVGVGTVGLALAKALVGRSAGASQSLLLFEKSPDQRREIGEVLGGPLHESNFSLLQRCDLIFLAVKPQDASSVTSQIRPFLSPSSLVVSLMGGPGVPALRAMLEGHGGIIRIMPNLPFVIGEGMGGIFYSPEISPAQREMVAPLLGVMGELIEVQDEKLLDVFTAISASGPGFLSYLIDELILVAEDLGLSAVDARRVVLRTIAGTVKYLEHSGEKPANLVRKVATPGGTTEAALSILRSASVGESLKAAVSAAVARCKEL